MSKLFVICAPSQAYFELCRKTRQRYDRELNWASAGKRLGEILHRVVNENSQVLGDRK